ncbi:MAG: TonB-dependent receptor [Acidobacteria bacterium]|nr:TonB-dependent receptor [Acidobacteriota bacterium]
MRSLHRLASTLLVAALFLAAPSLFAQTQATTGVIQGTVTDPTGAVVPGARVTVTNVGTGFERAVATDDNGFYRAILLPLGTYKVAVEKEGFARLVLEKVEVTLGAAVPVNAELKVAPAGEEVIVTAEEPLIGTATTETSELLGERPVHQLPLASRNYLDYLTLTPNVQISMGTDGPQINVNGQKGVQTGFQVDGAAANNNFFGEQRGGQRPVANVVLEAVKEFQVVAEGAPPEFGGYSGAFINVVTKSGTNEFHGSLFHFQDAGALTWHLADNSRLKSFHREQFGGSVGGPIKKDKAFFFGTYEHVNTRFQKDNDLLHCCALFAPADMDGDGAPDDVDGDGTPELAAIFAPPTAGGVLVDLDDVFGADPTINPMGISERGPLRHTNDLQAFLIKGDFLPNPSHTITARHYFARSIQQNGTFDIRTFGRTANGEEFSRTNAFIGSWIWALSPKYLNEFRFQYARDWRPREHVQPPDLPDTSIGPCTQQLDFAEPIPGCLGRNFRFGRPFFHPSTVLDEQFQWNNNFSIVSGRHNIKVGFNVYHIRIKNFFQGFARGRFTFSSVEGFLNYLTFGPSYTECSDGTLGVNGMTATCLPPAPFTLPAVPCDFTVDPSVTPSSCAVGPLPLFLQFSPIGNNTIDDAANNNFTQNEQGFFIQDKWQARPGLTLTYGLRWDNYNQRQPIVDPAQSRYGQFLDDPRFPLDGTVPGYHKAFQPRGGLAWDPWNDGKTVFRLNGGVFFSRIPALMIANATANNGAIAGTIFSASFFNVLAQFLPFLSFLDPPVYPDCETGPFSPPSCPIPPNFQPFDPGIVAFANDFVYPRTYQWSIWGEREIVRDWAISAGFNYAHATHLNRLVGFNHPGDLASGLVPAPPVAIGTDGRQMYSVAGVNPLLFEGGPFSGPGGNGTGIATFSGVITSQASSLYRAFTIKVDKKYSNNYMLTAHYTYARDIDDDSNERDQFTFQYSDPNDFSGEKGPSNRDRRHRFTLFSLWDLPWGFRWSNTLVIQSSTPRSLLCGFDANLDSSAAGDRVFTDGQGNFSCGPGSVIPFTDPGPDGILATADDVITLVPRLIQLSENQVVPLTTSLTNGFDTGRNRFRRNDEQVDWSMRIQKDFVWGERYRFSPILEIFNITGHDNFRFPVCDELQTCFLGTFFQIPGDPRRVRLAARFEW